MSIDPNLINLSSSLFFASTKTFLISGSHGLVGSALTSVLEKGGHKVLRLVRHSSAGPGEIEWKKDGSLELVGEKIDAVINLAGAGIADSRWTKERKELIFSSRVDRTRVLSNQIELLNPPPTAFLSASAIGYYGDRGDETLTERSSPGSGFLAETAKAWEETALGRASSGTRIIFLRFGMILSKDGGALRKMLPIFKLGLGGRLGRGDQIVSWISLVDVVRGILFVLESGIEGPINFTSPNPLPNSDFTEILGGVLRRPTLFHAPRSALKLIFGELAEEVLLSSQKIMPAKLLEAGFEFKFPTLKSCLEYELGGN